MEPDRSLYETAISSMVAGISPSSAGSCGLKRPHEQVVQGELGVAPGEMEVAVTDVGEPPVEDIPDQVVLLVNVSCPLAGVLGPLLDLGYLKSISGKSSAVLGS